MPLCSQRVIDINGVRYQMAIRMDTNWSYTAEWWNNSEYHRHTFDGRVRSSSQAERVAIDEMHTQRSLVQKARQAAFRSEERGDGNR